jgi:hypothetical protein
VHDQLGETDTMLPTHLTRRDFHKLSSAAMAGMLAGTTAGCSRPAAEEKASAPAASADKGKPEVTLVAAAEVHVCRGLNACQGKGADGKNACAGQGTCSTVKAHGCGGENECKGQGGCGETPGENSCKGQGGCGVPLEHAWDKARKRFEERMKKENKTFGDAPKKKSE